VADLAAADPDVLAGEVGPATGPWLVRLAQGRDGSPVSDAPHVPRSCGRETTFQHDLDDWDDVRREVSRLARRVAGDVAEDGRDVFR
ncbi:DNA polymerase IV, partial [Micromonospora aurantiaca]|nr:DNA polymerase IV [Micromonospora aurantiaca]